MHSSVMHALWRYILPIILVLIAFVEGMAGCLWLINQPSDLVVAFGCIGMVILAALTVGLLSVLTT